VLTDQVNAGRSHEDGGSLFEFLPENRNNVIDEVHRVGQKPLKITDFFNNKNAFPADFR
jgi:hypothetical protein